MSSFSLGQEADLTRGQGNTFLPSSRRWDFAAFGTEYPTRNPKTWIERVRTIHHRASSPSLLDATGMRSNAFGLSDMFGNVWQWCDRGRGETMHLENLNSSEKTPTENDNSYGDGFELRFSLMNDEFPNEGNDVITTNPDSFRAEIRGGGFFDDLSRISIFVDSLELADGIDTRHSDIGFRLAADVPIRTLPKHVREHLALSDTGTNLHVTVAPPPSSSPSYQTATPLQAVKFQRGQLMAIPDRLLGEYDDFLKQSNTGIVKMLAWPTVRDNVELLGLEEPVPPVYTFVTKRVRFEGGGDFQFRDGKLSTGNAGLDFGHFMNLGTRPISDLDFVTDRPPQWLNNSEARAWMYLWQYSPPTITAEARRHQYEARAKSIAGIPLLEVAPALQGSTYLLRSINYRDSDLLVALKIADVLEDGSIIIVWRILNSYPIPTATGPEPVPL